MSRHQPVRAPVRAHRRGTGGVAGRSQAAQSLPDHPVKSFLAIVFGKEWDHGSRNVYSIHPRLANEIDTRGIDEYNPIWNILDLTPQGRGDWDASLQYGIQVPARR
jgi:hypothetical protein